MTHCPQCELHAVERHQAFMREVVLREQNDRLWRMLDAAGAKGEWRSEPPKVNGTYWLRDGEETLVIHVMDPSSTALSRPGMKWWSIPIIKPPKPYR